MSQNKHEYQPSPDVKSDELSSSIQRVLKVISIAALVLSAHISLVDSQESNNAAPNSSESTDSEVIFAYAISSVNPSDIRLVTVRDGEITVLRTFTGVDVVNPTTYINALSSTGYYIVTDGAEHIISGIPLDQEGVPSFELARFPSNNPPPKISIHPETVWTIMSNLFIERSQQIGINVYAHNGQTEQTVQVESSIIPFIQQYYFVPGTDSVLLVGRTTQVKIVDDLQLSTLALVEFNLATGEESLLLDDASTISIDHLLISRSFVIVSAVRPQTPQFARHMPMVYAIQLGAHGTQSVRNITLGLTTLRSYSDQLRLNQLVLLGQRLYIPSHALPSDFLSSGEYNPQHFLPTWYELNLRSGKITEATDTELENIEKNDQLYQVGTTYSGGTELQIDGETFILATSLSSGNPLLHQDKP